MTNGNGHAIRDDQSRNSVVKHSGSLSDPLAIAYLHYRSNFRFVENIPGWDRKGKISSIGFVIEMKASAFTEP